MNLAINNLTLTPYTKNIKQIILIVFLFLTVVKCSNNQVFDKLYYNQEYNKAYESVVTSCYIRCCYLSSFIR